MRFGDADPEDGWDRGDSTAILVHNLVRRAELLTGRRLRLTGDYRATLDELARLVARQRRHPLSTPDRIRADLIDEDVAYLRGRVR